MKERPILFSGPMVRAILEGRKTQTRRVVKDQPCAGAMLSRDAYAPSGFSFVHDLYDDQLLTCPYGKPGDRLWVRESFCKSPDGILYRATGDDAGMLEPGDSIQWKPSIHMPRWASRITLEATGVGVERLQDISEDDAKSEGASEGMFETEVPGRLAPLRSPMSYRAGFACLWESINGPGSWDANPWVWVIEFQRITHPAENTAPWLEGE